MHWEWTEGGGTSCPAVKLVKWQRLILLIYAGIINEGEGIGEILRILMLYIYALLFLQNDVSHTVEIFYI